MAVTLFEKKIKDPQGKVDFVYHADEWLPEGDLLESGLVTIYDPGTENPNTEVVIVSEECKDLEYIVWLSGGVLGSKYWVTLHYVTEEGREDDCTFELTIQEK